MTNWIGVFSLRLEVFGAAQTGYKLERKSPLTISYSRWVESPRPPLLQSRALKVPFTRLLSRRPLSWVPFEGLSLPSGPGPAVSRLLLARIAPSPRRSVGLAHLWRYSLRSPPHHRPDVSLSWALPQAFASSGILFPSRMRLALTPEGHWPHRGPAGGHPSVPHLHCLNP